jgi:tRNA dimethylallyltransferase
VIRRIDPVLVAVLGPTASGKSAVAMAVAERLGDVDLVSVDAMQVYRGMDIGTAKPTIAERERVPHHLIDLVDAADEFSVAEFQQHFARVRDLLASTRRRGLLVGGTGLYHRAVVDGLTLPGQWPETRAELEAEAAGSGPEALYERLAAIDPVAAARMEPTNVRRIVRALEVCVGSGRPFSSFGPGLDAHPHTDVTQIGLRWDREVLAARIERRVREMVDAGFLDEVRNLLVGGMSRTARQALGYRELTDHLEHRCTLDEAVGATVLRTRQFAVRQLRWFQRDPRIRWVDVVDDPVVEAAPVVVAALDDT